MVPVCCPPTRSHPPRQSYCFNMNNEWFNLSSGCQRTARCDYFLGAAVTFIGSGHIRVRPDRVSDGQRDTEGDGQTERYEENEDGSGEVGFVHLNEQQH